MSRLIDADALIEFCAERWIPLNIDAVNMQPTIQPQSTTGKLNDGARSTAQSTDLIDRQATIDALDTAIEHYDGIAEECRKKADIERNDYMDMRDDAYEAQQLAQWLNELKYLREKIEQLTIKPEPTDEQVEEYCKKRCLHVVTDDYFRLVQPEPSIPLSWIEKYIEWLKSFDNEFANLAAAHISVMVKKWRDEQDETD